MVTDFEPYVGAPSGKDLVQMVTAYCVNRKHLSHKDNEVVRDAIKVATTFSCLVSVKESRVHVKN